MHCGASTTPQVHCPNCNQLQPSGARFCMGCGAGMAGATHSNLDLTAGAVIEGVWQRGPDEFIRRVLPEDCRTFLGQRVVRVPPGTVGVVVVGGRVERLLPPGEQTAVPLFERISNFFSGQGSSTAFYLLDLRPIPIPFALQTRPVDGGTGEAGGARSIAAQVLVSFALPRGDRDALGVFLDSVLGARSGFSAGDLYSLLRPEVTRLSSLVLERLSARGALRYAEAEAEIRAVLAEQLARRYGLLVEVSVAPLTTTASLSFRLGEGDKASLFSSDGEALELDVVLRVQGQHEDFAPERLRPALHGAAAARLRGLPFAEVQSGAGLSAIEEALRADVARELAAFGMQLVSIHVIDLRSRSGVWLLGARAELQRAEDELGVKRAWLAQDGRALDLKALVEQHALRQRHVEREAKLQGLAAELAGGRTESTLRREDSFGRDQEALADRQRREALTKGQARLDVSDAEQAAQRKLGVDAAGRTVVLAQRADRKADELDALQHEGQKADAAFTARAGLTRKELDLAEEQRRRGLRLESETTRRRAEDGAFAARQRDGAAFEDHAQRARLQVELAEREQAAQLDKLRAMSALDREMAAQEQAHELALRESLRGLSEREMIAMQAAQLAKGEGGGAAWAQALAAGEAQREKEQRLVDKERHAGEVKDLLQTNLAALQGVMQAQLDRMADLTGQALASASERQRDAGAAGVYRGAMDALGQVAAARAAPAPVVAAVAVPAEAAASSAAPAASAAPCSACGTALRPGARFCPSCGAEKAG